MQAEPFHVFIEKLVEGRRILRQVCCQIRTPPFFDGQFRFFVDFTGDGQAGDVVVEIPLAARAMAPVRPIIDQEARFCFAARRARACIRLPPHLAGSAFDDDGHYFFVSVKIDIIFSKAARSDFFGVPPVATKACADAATIIR